MNGPSHVVIQSRIHGENRQMGATSSYIHHAFAKVNPGHAAKIHFTPLDGTLPNIKVTGANKHVIIK